MKVYTLKIYREASIDIQVSVGDWRQIDEIQQGKDELECHLILMHLLTLSEFPKGLICNFLKIS